MGLLKTVAGTIAVLFSIQPLASWAAESTTDCTPSDGGSMTVKMNGASKLEIQTDGPVEIQSDGSGHVIILNTGKPSQLDGIGAPQCGGGGG